MTEPFIGNVQYFAFGYAPKGWQLCDGTLLQVNSNQALFALLGTMYGGDGRTTFGVPDLRGRTITGLGPAHPTQGAKMGTESVTLSAANVPAHTHSVQGQIQIPVNNGTAGNQTSPAGAYFSAAPGGSRPQKIYATAPDANSFLGGPTTISVANTGGSAPVDIRSPYIALTCAIATIGIFPPRN